MEKAITRDHLFLSLKALDATAEDIPSADDLMDTLKAHAEDCVGMAANMIGIQRRIIVFCDNGRYEEMFNPELLSGKEPYETEEGCLSLDGKRRVKRYRSIRVRWQTRSFAVRIKTFTGFTAEIIQHEIDHCCGILI